MQPKAPAPAAQGAGVAHDTTAADKRAGVAHDLNAAQGAGDRVQGAVLPGAKTETVEAINHLRDIAIDVLRNDSGASR